MNKRANRVWCSCWRNWTKKSLMWNHSWFWGFPGGSDGKESACNEGDQVGSLGWEDSLEKGMATHTSILAWRIPWMEEPGRFQFTMLQRVGHDWATNTFIVSLLNSYSQYRLFFSFIIWTLGLWFYENTPNVALRRFSRNRFSSPWPL